MSEENKEVIRRLYEEVWNQHGPEAADELVAPDVFNPDMVPEHQHGIDGYKHLVRWYTPPPLTSITTSRHRRRRGQGGDFVTYGGTHTGEVRNVAPTGRRVSVKQPHWYRLVDGRVAENWSVRDDLGMRQQMGVLSMPGKQQTLYQQKRTRP